VKTAARIRSKIFFVALILPLLAACTDSEPTLPSSTDPEAVQATLTAPDGGEKLLDISKFEWPDDGAKAAEYFQWIAPDAQSADQAEAARAGRAAQVLARVLAGNRGELESISPKLLNAYATALAPFQGAMVGDDTGVRGFGDPGDLVAARDVFAVMASDTDTKNAFVEAAYDRALSIGASGATQVCADKNLASSVGRLAVSSAAALFGLAGSIAEPPRDRPQSIDQLSHAMASACLLVAKQPPKGKITEYLVGGRLLPPDEIAHRDGTLEAYYQSLRDYLGYMGIDTSRYSELYDEAKGQ
jgi:hypothetical protein